MQLFAFLVPIVGLGAFLWWAGRDMVQDSVRLLFNFVFYLLKLIIVFATGIQYLFLL